MDVVVDLLEGAAVEERPREGEPVRREATHRRRKRRWIGKLPNRKGEKERRVYFEQYGAEKGAEKIGGEGGGGGGGGGGGSGGSEVGSERAGVSAKTCGNGLSLLF